MSGRLRLPHWTHTWRVFFALNLSGSGLWCSLTCCLAWRCTLPVGCTASTGYHRAAGQEALTGPPRSNPPTPAGTKFELETEPSLYLDEHPGLVCVVSEVKSVPFLIWMDVQGGHLTDHLWKSYLLFICSKISFFLQIINWLWTFASDLLKRDKMSRPGEDSVLYKLLACHTSDLEDLKMANLQVARLQPDISFTKVFGQTSSELSAKLSPDTWKLLNFIIWKIAKKT